MTELMNEPDNIESCNSIQVVGEYLNTGLTSCNCSSDQLISDSCCRSDRLIADMGTLIIKSASGHIQISEPFIRNEHIDEALFRCKEELKKRIALDIAEQLIYEDLVELDGPNICQEPTGSIVMTMSGKVNVFRN